MPETEQKYGNFREKFRESTTMSLKKLEIQNELLKSKLVILEKNANTFRIVTVVLAAVIVLYKIGIISYMIFG
jgi:hypothetical protein